MRIGDLSKFKCNSNSQIDSTWIDWGLNRGPPTPPANVLPIGLSCLDLLSCGTCDYTCTNYQKYSREIDC